MHEHGDHTGWPSRYRGQRPTRLRRKVPGVATGLGKTGPPCSGDELAEARATIEHLERALQTNRRIGMAMGILMERHQLTADAAFATLTRLSHTANRKLAELAGELVDTRRLPSAPDSGEWT